MERPRQGVLCGAADMYGVLDTRRLPQYCLVIRRSHRLQGVRDTVHAPSEVVRLLLAW